MAHQQEYNKPNLAETPALRVRPQTDAKTFAVMLSRN